jgi:hypothetical protein
MSHGINANVVRNWLPLYRDQQFTDLPAFLPLKMPTQRACDIANLLPHQWVPR